MGIEQNKQKKSHQKQTEEKRECRDTHLQILYRTKLSNRQELTMRVDAVSVQVHVLKRLVTVGMTAESWKEVNMGSKTYV